MNVGAVRIAFALFWLVVAAAVFARNHLFGANADNQVGGGRSLDLTAYLAVGLAVWNLVRWWAGRGKTAPTQWPEGRQPLAPRDPTAERKEEYNPELDAMQRPDDPRV